MELNAKMLYDKIKGCWNGKNIGGVLGAPLEGKRGVFDVQSYLQQDMDGNPPPMTTWTYSLCGWPPQRNTASS